MKKTTIFVCATALAFTAAACGGAQNNNAQTEEQTEQQPTKETVEETAPAKEKGAFPWDFPEGTTNPGMEAGQTVLSCHSFYPSKIMESDEPENETYIFYSGELKTVGEAKSTVKGIGSDAEMPNSLIIPIPKGQKAKKGDIVLTWWQSGSGMKRAIVTDASKPDQPKVDYLDMDWTEDGKGFANSHADEQLKPNSFVVLNNNEWTPGQTVIDEGNGDKMYTIISVTDTQVLGCGFAGKISVLDRSTCKLIPLKQDLKAGDTVKGEFVGSLSDGFQVVKVDEKIGRVWVKDNFNSDKILSILQVLK
ncbi:MAG: hypothetical protein J5826_03790 [Bacteroidales bacterium]|nr:hypothetical protein [Bacteroidales bacterium]